MGRTASIYGLASSGVDPHGRRPQHARSPRRPGQTGVWCGSIRTSCSRRGDAARRLSSKRVRQRTCRRTRLHGLHADRTPRDGGQLDWSATNADVEAGITRFGAPSTEVRPGSGGRTPVPRETAVANRRATFEVKSPFDDSVVAPRSACPTAADVEEAAAAAAETVRGVPAPAGVTRAPRRSITSRSASSETIDENAGADRAARVASRSSGRRSRRRARSRRSAGRPR